jgi:heavy metal-(Cd/Co/Hg/Pb/Zn)-translocating P-type ATPase
MTKKHKKMLMRIISSTILLITAMLIPAEEPLKLILFLIPYLVIGWNILWDAIRNITKGQIFDENFLMAIATVGAFFLSEYAEGVFVMLFYQVGELFQSYAVGKSRKSISALMDIRPDHANIEKDGELIQVDPESVSVDDIIIVKPGEKIPLDGVVTDGASTLNTSALTGESLPRDVSLGDDVISGCVNQTGILRVRVTKAFGESTVSKILDLVENASSKKARAENFITRFARYYTPIVVIFAALLAIVPPLLFSDPWSIWVERALIFLVVSCPCALVISIPLSFFGGIGGASREGILIKGASFMELLAKTETLVFDKTGTLTKGNFIVSKIHSDSIDNAKLLEYASLAEYYSDHPISKSLKTAFGKSINTARISEYEEIAGHGVKASIDGKIVAAGNDKLMKILDIPYDECNDIDTIVHIAINGTYAGHIIISDEIRPEAESAIRALKTSGVKEIVMLTGDAKAIGTHVAEKLGFDSVHTDLLPAGKVDIIETLLEKKPKNSTLAFVGDGINDAPVLSRADVGIAMGGLGSDAAIEAADIVLMEDNLSKIASAINISKKTLQIVKQNTIFALVAKFAVLILSTFGLTNMWAAIFADVGVMVIAVLNAGRTLNLRKK